MNARAFPFLEFKIPYLDCHDSFHDNNSCQYIDINAFNGIHFRQQKQMSINIIGINIRSIRHNFTELQLLLSTLSIHFHIITIVETWLIKSIDRGFEIDGYQSFSVYRNSNGGGIKVYVDDAFSAGEISNACQTNEFFESLFLNINADNRKFTLGCIYRIPSYSIYDFNDKFFDDFMSGFNNVDTIILGDMNVNLYNPIKLNSINEFVHNFLAYRYKPLIRYPTCFHPNNPITKYSFD